VTTIETLRARAPFLEGLVVAALRLLAHVVAPIGALIARTGVGSDVCLDRGFLPVPVHFYQPVFDHREVPPSVWDRRHDLPGIDFRERDQLTLLAELGAFGHECSWPRIREVDGGYFWENAMFGFTSACLLHAMVRLRRPARVVEVGAGMSTFLFLAALEANGGGELVSIDPYPASYLSELGSGDHVIIDRPVQEVAPEILADADFLFIDSSHVSRTGSDVNMLYLDVLPRLSSGTTVHVHDVYLPFEYPREYAKRERSRYFWNEQYILQAFLSLNESYRVELAGHWSQTIHQSAFASAFPKFDPELHRPSSSIYLARV
jgi:predicted O-methyltransferase YrrM